MSAIKIAVYNEKGRVGKTPLALELALRRGLNYATNQNRPRADIKQVIPEDEFLQVEPNQAFPSLDSDFPVVFDLAGELVGYEKSILSAIKQVDLIIVPVVNEADAIEGTAYAIAELKTLKGLKAKFLVVANLLKTPEDFETITTALNAKLGDELPTLPLQYSRAFDHIFREGRSIKAIVEEGGLRAWNFRKVKTQLDAINNHIDSL